MFLFLVLMRIAVFGCMLIFFFLFVLLVMRTYNAATGQVITEGEKSLLPPSWTVRKNFLRQDNNGVYM